MSTYPDTITITRNAAPTDADRAIVEAITTPEIDAAVNALTAWRDLLGIVVDQGGSPTWRPSLEVCRRRAYRNTCGACSVCRPVVAPPRAARKRRVPAQQPLLLPVSA